jgi:hypothetical protein
MLAATLLLGLLAAAGLAPAGPPGDRSFAKLSDTSTDGNHYVVGGNQSDGVTHPQYSNWASSIVGYASAAPK